MTTTDPTSPGSGAQRHLASSLAPVGYLDTRKTTQGRTAPGKAAMARCTDSPRIGRASCGQSFSGELQHCVASVSWSRHPDGLAHVTASRSVIDAMWAKGDGTEPADPAALGFAQDSSGRWRAPAGEWRPARG